MITDHGGEARISHEQLQYFFALGTLGDEIADGNNAILLAQFRLLEQGHELVITTVNIAYYNRPTLHPGFLFIKLPKNQPNTERNSVLFLFASLRLQSSVSLTFNSTSLLTGLQNTS